jgi:hypothetical protein
MNQEFLVMYYRKSLTYFFVGGNIFLNILVSDGSRDGVVGIVTGYG